MARTETNRQKRMNMTTQTITRIETPRLGTARQQMAKLNYVEADVFAWWLTRHTKEGRNTLFQARAVQSDISVRLGGGVNPFQWTRQEDVAKTRDHNGNEWVQGILYSSAAKSGGFVNACPWSTPQCRAGCLQSSGHLGMSNGQIAMHVRSEFWWRHTFEAAICLLDETERHSARIHKCGKKVAQRLNGTTDYPWERAQWFLTLLREAGVDIHFDYTKGHRREGNEHYYLARSVTERMSYDDIRPLMVVVVDAVRGMKLPPRWAGMPVIDGDLTNGDLRFLDPQTNPDAVVLLRKKGSLRNVLGSEDGFVKELHVA